MSGKSGQLVVSSFYDEGEDIHVINGKVVISNLIFRRSTDIITRETFDYTSTDASKRFGKGFISNLLGAFAGVDYIEQRTSVFAAQANDRQFNRIMSVVGNENEVQLLVRLFKSGLTQLVIKREGDSLIVNGSPLNE